MSQSVDVFRTFCHISEYGEPGYANLHRMIATSSPLVLWAPSSRLVSSSGCRLTEREFVTLVDRGTVRIIGRKQWLTDRASRDSHPWEGASWTPLIDDAIRAMALQDASQPENLRRVVMAEEERGDTWASSHVGENPELVALIYEVLLAPDANLHFPVGVVETATRFSDDPVGLAERIVRDAYNHDAAIAQSGTNTPFLLARRESRFNELLESVREASDIQFSQVEPAAELSRSDLAELTSEVLKVLGHLEHGRKTSVGRFVQSEGHQLLAEWMQQSCESLGRTGAANVRGEVLARLRQEFDGDRLENSWSKIFKNPEFIIGSAAGAAASVIETIASELTILGGIGLAAGAYSIGNAFAKRAGFAAAPYAGPQWAFIYAFGKRASGRRRARLEMTLDKLGSSD